MSTPTTSHLLHAIAAAQAGQFRESLAAIRSAKCLDSENIHILALERQLVRITEFEDPAILSSEERDETLELLRVLAHRATQSLHDHLYSLDDLLSAKRPQVPSASPDGKKQSTKTELINQYLLRADQWLSRGDRDGALLEIHRVYVVEPENTKAHEFEERILHLPLAESWALKLPPFPPKSCDRSEPEALVGTKAPASGTLAAPEEDARLLTDLEADTPGEQTRKSIVGARMLKVAMRGSLVIALGASLSYYFWWKNVDDQVRMQQSLERLASPGSRAEDPNPVPPEGGSTEPKNQSAKVAAHREKPQVTTERKKTEARLEAVHAEAGQNPNAGNKTVETGPSHPRPRPAVQKVEPSGVLRAGTVPSGVIPRLTPIESSSKLEAAGVLQSSADRQQSLPGERGPQLVRLATIRFPETARRNGIEGDVTVRVRVHQSGKPLWADIVESTNTALNDAVIDAVMRSEFSPGLMPSGPVTTWATIPLHIRK